MPSKVSVAPDEANWLLGALPTASHTQFNEWCETVPTPVGMIISEVDEPIAYAYFPLSGCQSIVMVDDGVAMAEVGTIGWEGMTGLSFLHGVDAVPMRCFVQVSGFAKRILAKDFHRQLEANTPLRNLMHFYAQHWVEQSAISIGCNGLHSIEQRCARWLLHTHDRVNTDVVPLTQEFLAIMLAVRRASVSVAAEALQKANLIAYRRGKITIIDRAGLEAVCCGCYGSIHASYRRLLPRPAARKQASVA